VVELPRWLWLPILHGIVLRSRPAASARKYQAIWTAEGSPLAVHTARQAQLLRSLLKIEVRHAMRYGAPSIGEQIGKLPKPRVVVPLYPQYSRSTTATVTDLLPGESVVQDFHDHPGYIAALAAQVRAHWAAHGRGERLVMSFHGLPQRAVDRGDPYETQCRKTASLLGATLKVDYLVTFQSRFGAAKWLQPYTEPTLVELARRGVRRVDVVCPGFVCDCLETLEEIGIVARRAFTAAGGDSLQLVACLNESPAWITALARIALGGAPQGVAE
jgi:ferrochelatase